MLGDTHASKMEKRHENIFKELVCKTNISDHDLQIKMRKAMEVLEKGFKVSISGCNWVVERCDCRYQDKDYEKLEGEASEQTADCIKNRGNSCRAWESDKYGWCGKGKVSAIFYSDKKVGVFFSDETFARTSAFAH